MSHITVGKVPLSYATCSIGNTSTDTLHRKIEAIKDAGFTGIEMSFPDLLNYAHHVLGHEVSEDNYDELIAAASQARKLCESHKLQIMMLQPFANFEGWPRSSKERLAAFERANGWIRIMDALGVGMLQVGSTDIPRTQLSSDLADDVVTDLRELCDRLAAHGGKTLAYENWCWSTHAPTWRDVWEIIQRVDRPNIGLCLDTFQTAGSEWGDPSTVSGRVEDWPRSKLDSQFSKSMADLAATVPPEKIYVLQISDAYKPRTPFSRERVDGLWPRARWSHSFRPLPYDGGYLPVEEVTRAVLETGFRSWFSIEVFDGDTGGERRPHELGNYARLAKESVVKLLEGCS